MIQMSSRTAQSCAKMDAASIPTLEVKDSAQFVIKNLCFFKCLNVVFVTKNLRFLISEVNSFQG